MPPLPLAKVLNVALPSLSGEARAVVDVLACKNGLLPPAGDVATFLGLRTRHQVARTLRRASLPPLEELAAWTRLFYWVLQWEQTGASLLNLARQAHLEPATCYRLVRRLMGAPWSRVRRGGISGAILHFQTVWKDSRQHRLALQPYLQAGARREDRLAVGAGPIASVFVVRAPRSPSYSTSEVPGKPRGILASRLSMPGYPFDVAIAPDGTAWLTRLHAAVLERLQLQPLASTGSIRVGIAPTRVIMAPTGERAWVTNQFTHDVAVVDLVWPNRVGSIAMEGDALGAALAPDGRTLYVTTNLDRLCVCALTENGGRIVRSMSLALATTEIAVHPAGNRVYVPTWKAGTILEIDARTLAITHRYELGGRPLGVAISRDGLRLYAGNEDGWLDLIHLPTGKVMRRNLGTPMDEVALTPDQSALYASLRTAGRIAILDAHTLTAVGTLETGGLPRHVAFNALGSAAIVANEAGWVDLVR
ncbi:MAG TPA: YncE family protein [Gemmatimonadales bacterium]